jgi:hypothetical protein
MPAAATPAPPSTIVPLKQPGFRNYGKIIVIALVIVAALAVAAVVIFASSDKWPYSQAFVLKNLQEDSDSRIEVRSFRKVYFPSPGCVLEGMAFRHQPGEAKPLITIQKLTIQGTYTGILFKRVHRIVAEGMLVSIPPFGTETEFHTTQSEITTDEIIANGAAVEFAYDDKKILRFDIHEAQLRNVGPNTPMTYRLKVHNPEPPGEVTTSGKFGPWKRGNAGETPISGEYKFEQADLGVYDGIAGTLSSTGKFSGNLGHIDISGVTDTPDFKVKTSSHPVHLTTKFAAYVDGTRGDTFLQQVDVDFWKTHLVARGSIAGSQNRKGKTALIEFRSHSARIEDLLRLFIKAPRAPMSGSTSLEARVEIPPGDERFLKKIRLQGSFGISGGTFSNPSTQEGVDKLSAGARGEKEKEGTDPETALTDLKGQVTLLDGVARFTDLSFGVAGASARMHGIYNLLNEKIDLRGQMAVDSKVSNTTSGAKAFLMKVMEPFFKKKHKGEIVPVRISGTYEHPTFGLDLKDKNAQDVPSP